MTKKLSARERENWLKYKKPGSSNIHRAKVNELNVTPANSLAHELAKCRIFWVLRSEGFKVLTEAQEISTGLRRDLVDLSNSTIWEIENSKSKRGHRHPKEIQVYWYDLKRARSLEEGREDV